MEDSTTYQAILARGRDEGRLEGQIEGALQEAQKFLLRLGQKSLGPPDAAAMAAVHAIADVQRLEQLGERVSEVASWQELLGLPARRRKSKQ